MLELIKTNRGFEMNVYLLGDFSENLDEGYKNITFNIAEELSDRHRIVRLNTKEIFSISFWMRVQNIDTTQLPQIVHYISAPTIGSLVILKFFSLRWRGVKNVASALYPNFSYLFKRFIPFLKPDLILTQSHESNKIFRDLGCKTRYLPNGVNTDKFLPVTELDKKRLRSKYGIDEEKFVVLHVGHVERKRNLRIFEKIQDENCQVIIVGSKYIEVDQELCRHLKSLGCIVHIGFCKNIEELYALSDCYIFPVITGGSILTPLSVMEAMSCNLPVITRNFEGLTRIFKGGDGLIFAKDDVDIVRALGIVKNGISVKTREKVLPYSWKSVGNELDKIYMGLK